MYRRRLAHHIRRLSQVLQPGRHGHTDPSCVQDHRRYLRRHHGRRRRHLQLDRDRRAFVRRGWQEVGRPVRRRQDNPVDGLGLRLHGKHDRLGRASRRPLHPVGGLHRPRRHRRRVGRPARLDGLVDDHGVRHVLRRELLVPVHGHPAARGQPRSDPLLAPPMRRHLQDPRRAEVRLGPDERAHQARRGRQGRHPRGRAHYRIPRACPQVVAQRRHGTHLLPCGRVADLHLVPARCLP
mmetsp:Transcript_21954/g.56039  ORF Transcript_21954/g.56039 Transcript_21954/m.56039 type:complete len:238 (-) Transcript_21954:668-1381(-)